MFDLSSIVDRNSHNPIAGRYAVILSAERADLSAKENGARTRWLESFLRNNNLPHKRLSGVYKGESEESFLVTANGPADVVELRNLARYYQQESVLVLFPSSQGNGRRAVLVELEPATEENPFSRAKEWLDRSVMSGPLRQITAEQARDLDAYTFDPSTGAYWAADLA